MLHHKLDIAPIGVKFPKEVVSPAKKKDGLAI
jgi:hypothetical protein